MHAKAQSSYKRKSCNWWLCGHFYTIYMILKTNTKSYNKKSNFCVSSTIPITFPSQQRTSFFVYPFKFLYTIQRNTFFLHWYSRLDFFPHLMYLRELVIIIHRESPFFSYSFMLFYWREASCFNQSPHAI